MGSRIRPRRLRGLVIHHRSHPSAHPRRLVRRVRSWGRGRSTASAAGAVSTLPRSSSPGMDTASMPTASPPARNPECSSQCARAARVLLTSSITDSPSTSPGRWDCRPSDARSHSRTCSGSVALATGARPGSSAVLHAISGYAHWTGEERSGPGD